MANSAKASIDGDSSELAVSGPRPFEKLRDAARAQADLNKSIVDPNVGIELQAAAIDAIAEADTLDAIFDANKTQTLPAAKDAAEKGPLTIYELEFRTSSEQYAKSGLGVFAYVMSFTDGGDQFEWSTGAPNVVASLYRMQELGLFNKPEKPRVRIVGKATGNGTMYSLGRP